MSASLSRIVALASASVSGNFASVEEVNFDVLAKFYWPKSALNDNLRKAGALKQAITEFSKVNDEFKEKALPGGWGSYKAVQVRAEAFLALVTGNSTPVTAPVEVQTVPVEAVQVEVAPVASEPAPQVCEAPEKWEAKVTRMGKAQAWLDLLTPAQDGSPEMAQAMAAAQKMMAQA